MFIIYSDKWCEQGGTKSQRTATITFLKPFKDTNYTLIGNEIMNYFTAEYELSLVKNSNTQFSYYCDYGGGSYDGVGCCWKASGYIN